MHTLKEKGVLKRCLWGTILENGAFFGKKGTISVPLGHQNGVIDPSYSKSKPSGFGRFYNERSFEWGFSSGICLMVNFHIHSMIFSEGAELMQ